MVGPLKTAVGGYNHIFVAIDKFTKWIEVKPVIATTAAKAAEFIEEISHRFGGLTRSSQIWVLLSRAPSSGTTAKRAALTSTTPP